MPPPAKSLNVLAGARHAIPLVLGACLVSFFFTASGSSGQGQVCQPYPPSPATGICGTEGPDTLTGTNVGDIILGYGGDDTIHGLGSPPGDAYGPDDLKGGKGDDTVYGDEGENGIDGGAGNDRLFGGPDYDAAGGGSGDDKVFGGGSKDDLDGGPGNDRLSGGRGPDAWWAALAMTATSAGRETTPSPRRRMRRLSAWARTAPPGRGATWCSPWDGVRERVDCGSGIDEAVADKQRPPDRLREATLPAKAPAGGRRLKTRSEAPSEDGPQPGGRGAGCAIRRSGARHQVHR